MYIEIYIYVELNHLAVLQKLTQHCKSTSIKKSNLKNQSRSPRLVGVSSKYG